jgi:diguanylate cyclase (GGDEF)-like protein
LDNALLYHHIEESAVRDGLTHLLTHKAFEERLEEEILRAGRYRYPLTLLMLDVDFFKKVNDTYGHPAGDEVLRRLSKHLSAAARPVDVVARYGGEEFCLLWVDVPKDQALSAAESLRQAVQAERFDLSEGKFSVAISGGLASYPDEATTAPQLVRGADQRLYQAKAQGRNRIIAQ